LFGAHPIIAHYIYTINAANSFQQKNAPLHKNERASAYYLKELAELKFCVANYTFRMAFNNPEGFAAEVCLYFAFERYKAMLVKNAPNKCANK